MPVAAPAAERVALRCRGLTKVYADGATRTVALRGGKPSTRATT